MKPELKLRQERGCFFSSQEALPRLSLVPKATPRSSSRLPSSRRAFLPFPPASVSPGGQAAACTYLPGSRQAPRPGAAPGGGGGGSGQAWRQAEPWAFGERRSSRARPLLAGRCALGTPPSHRNERLGQLSNVLTREADAHTWLFKSCCGQGWKEVPLSFSRGGWRGIWGKVT